MVQHGGKFECEGLFFLLDIYIDDTGDIVDCDCLHIDLELRVDIPVFLDDAVFVDLLELLAWDGRTYAFAHVLADYFEGFDDDLEVGFGEQAVDDDVLRQQAVELLALQHLYYALQGVEIVVF